MLRTLLGAAAMAAAAYTCVPAYAAHVGGCSGDNLTKAESALDTMADVPAKFAAQREMAQAQNALLADNWGGCAMHLSRAMRSESMAQAPYAQYQASYPQTMAQTPFAAPTAPPPAETTQQNWFQWGPPQGQK
ncbi:hypothetical protein [Bradyrhizobium sp.]|uniref:hypothetical protein n=1 Tax=Bradyrhizobium sp. TaxID=376 RepID=UPI003C624D20